MHTLRRFDALDKRCVLDAGQRSRLLHDAAETLVCAVHSYSTPVTQFLNLSRTPFFEYTAA
jgi:hypothetical protein